MVHDAHKYCKEDPDTLKTLLDYCEKPLYNGCKYSKLSGLMKFQYLKGKYGWSDTSFSDLLCTLHDVLPDENSMPKSMYEAKVMTALGLEYEKIHACQNDCILLRNEYKIFLNVHLVVLHVGRKKLVNHQAIPKFLPRFYGIFLLSLGLEGCFNLHKLRMT
ncbi:hypothetical protein Patl1_15855 [Pistacia atlantica]|uniref:Uncharacterized protein n=1 Tax=Pistacia atlantica TaxID=434234 RepID=A0ACC1BB76_9ROSI|nr:hypothetical protein Patl1_15855 [Pistacia atlantica]